MVVADRHELTRAKWLLAHEAGWHLSDRRMANALKRRASQKNRASAGAAESAHHEGRIKWIGSRFVLRGDDSSERMWRVLALGIGFVVGGFVAGPALLVSVCCYTVTVEVALRRGRVPRLSPWLIAATAAAAIGVVVWVITGMPAPVWFTLWFPTMHIWIPFYLFLQIVGGLLLTGWQVRRHGWPGVIVKDSPEAPKLTAPGPSEASTDSSESRATQEPSSDSQAPKIAPLPTAPEVVGLDGFGDEDGADDEGEEDKPVFADDIEVIDTDNNSGSEKP